MMTVHKKEFSKKCMIYFLLTLMKQCNILMVFLKKILVTFGSIFDDLSEHFQSKELIECMEKNAKRTGFDCSVDIECAIEMLKN